MKREPKRPSLAPYAAWDLIHVANRLDITSNYVGPDRDTLMKIAASLAIIAVYRCAPSDEKSLLEIETEAVRRVWLANGRRSARVTLLDFVQFLPVHGLGALRLRFDETADLPEADAFARIFYPLRKPTAEIRAESPVKRRNSGPPKIKK